jgi:hypothetical protein
MGWDGDGTGGKRGEEPIREVVYAPPPRFDTGIGYWTGEADEEARQRALDAVAAHAPGVSATRCRAGHLHLRGSTGELRLAEDALAGLGLVPLAEGCSEPG